MTKRNKLTLCLALGLCALSCSALLGLTACSGADRWDVSADASSEVEAKLVGTEGGYRLNIGGKGAMTDFASAEAVPWYDKADEITEVSISYGVESVGAYALAALGNTGPVVLPSSVKRTGTEFVNEETQVFVFSEDIDFGSEAPENIYLYREETIPTEDRYWQSDKSKGDIVADGEDLSADEDKFWHYLDDDTPAVYKKIKVLFIGNSFTYRNGVVEFSSGVPGIFDNVAEDLGYTVETYSITGPGWYLENHAKAGDTCGKQVDKLLNATDDFDYVVLQDQSTVAFENYERFLGGIKALQSKIENTQKNAQIYLYETWGSPFSANERKITVPEMEKLLRDAYTKAGEECGVPVSYIGKAFTDVYTHDKSINLYASDNRHQGYPGAYLSACVHAASMLGADVRETTFVGEEQYSAPQLDEQTLTTLRDAAYNAVFGSEEDVTEPEETPDDEDETQKEILKIACWGRFMKQAKFDELIADFKNYCTENTVEYKEIVATYYEGATTSAPYYYIANFTSKVYQDGDPDIVLPCADNFNANQATLAAIDLLPVEVYGQTDRRVAALNDDELTKVFFEYIRTDSAKTILAKQD